MVKRALLLAATLWLAACEPSLREGYYACSTGECPSGWFCRNDGYCYRTPDPLKPTYDSCVVGQAGDATCQTGLCATGPDPEATTGMCSVQCTGDASCPGAPNAYCVSGTCVATCRSSADCPTGLGCYDLVGKTSDACFQVKDPRLDSSFSCTSTASCDPLTTCLLAPALDSLGVCSWPCQNPNDACPLNADCVDVSSLNGASPTGYACLTRCGATCANGLTCLKFPTTQNQKRCVPAGW